MTPADAAAIAALPAWAFAFVLVLARAGAAVMLLPGLGEADLPPIIRAGLALMLTILLLPATAPLIPPVPADFLEAARMIVAELLTGAWLGWLARMLALALPIAGQFLSYMLGVSNVLQNDAAMGAQTTALSRLFALAVPVGVLSSGLYALPIMALAGSYRLIAPGHFLPVQGGTEQAVAAAAEGFALALRLASPLIIAGIVWHIAVAMMARLTPRVQIYFLALPGQILGGLLLLGLVAGALIAAWQSALSTGFSALPGLH